MRRRQPSGSWPKCWRSEALYIMKRRLMKMVVRMTSAAGEPEARSCAAATIEAPAKTRSDISIAMSGVMPLATIATPAMTPNAATPGSTASAARAPATNSSLAELFADADPEVDAALVLALLAHLLAPCHAAAHLGFAFAGVLRLRAALLHHAIRLLSALFAFAGGAHALCLVAQLRDALLARLRIPRLRAHLVRHALGVRGALAAGAGLLGAAACSDDFVAARLAGFRILGARAIEAAFALGRLRVRERGAREQQRRENGVNRLFQASCFSIVAASDTSNLPGASTLSCFTTPLSTSIEKRCMRVPMPRALRSSSRPSLRVHSAEPSPRKRSLPSAFCSRAQCAMTKASLVATHQISLTPFFLSSPMFCT